jgi:hypothetical protein
VTYEKAESRYAGQHRNWALDVFLSWLVFKLVDDMPHFLHQDITPIILSLKKILILLLATLKIFADKYFMG